MIDQTVDPALEINPFYSPDGSHIAFQSDRSGRLEVWGMNSDGSDPHQVTKIGVGGHFMRWSRDSRSIFFRCPCGGKAQTHQAASTGTTPSPSAAHMSLSPDYSLIMDVVGHKTVWASPGAGGKPTKVYEFPHGESRIDYPVRSPDGKWVLFDRFRPQGGDIWTMGNFESCRKSVGVTRR